MPLLIRFSPGTGIAGVVVRWATWSWSGHVGFKLADGSVLDATPDFGVSQHVVSDDPGTKYFQVAAPESVLDAAVAAAHTQIGKPYDWTAIFGMALRRDLHKDDKYFCSEFLEWSFEKAGFPLLRTDHLDRITPRDLLLSPFLREV